MSLSERDRKLIWHPFTQEKTAALPIAIKRGKGAYLVDENDNHLLDLISSWWTNIHGHAEPLITRAIHQQCATLEHVAFAGFTHEPAVHLCESLATILPDQLCRFFFSDNGSTAVEVALKIAYQYWLNKGVSKNLFLSFEGGYHGDTFGAMSVSLKSNFHDPFADLCFEVKFVPFAGTWLGDEDTRRKELDALEQIDRQLRGYGDRIAAFIMEPLIQAAGGMRMCRPSFVDEVVALVRRHNILIIFDEVAVGFGRTGSYFALQQTNVVPDMICLSKGITGGFLPLALTVVTQNLFEVFLDDSSDKALLHGHSYTANPVGCAAAVASLELLTKPSTMESIKRIGKIHQEEMPKLIGECADAQRGRVCGTIAAFDLSPAVDVTLFRVACLREKIILRPLGKTFYLFPPYCITADELKNAYRIIREVLHSMSKK